jgi:hypothetical protein
MGFIRGIGRGRQGINFGYAGNSILTTGAKNFRAACPNLSFDIFKLHGLR